MKNYYNEEIEEGKYYNFKVFLDSPYKWGNGWEGVSTEERYKANQEIEDLRYVLGWRVQKGDSWSGDSLYKGFEEVYLHPMEISGTATLETIRKIEEYFKSCELEKYYDTRIFHEAIEYKDEDFVNMLETIEQTYTEVAKKEPWGIALNCITTYYPQFKFKDHSFINDEKNSRQKTYESLLVTILNNKIRGLRK